MAGGKRKAVSESVKGSTKRKKEGNSEDEKSNESGDEEFAPTQSKKKKMS